MRRVDVNNYSSWLFSPRPSPPSPRVLQAARGRLTLVEASSGVGRGSRRGGQLESLIDPAPPLHQRSRRTCGGGGLEQAAGIDAARTTLVTGRCYRRDGYYRRDGVC